MKKLYSSIFSFSGVYVSISIATLQHTMWSAAMVFEGPPPQKLEDKVFWYFSGFLIAVAIDVGMFVASHELAKRFTMTMVFTFILVAFASAYTQLIYAYSHVEEIQNANGVTDFWIFNLRPLIEARVIIMPLILPSLAVLYTLASSFHKMEVTRKEEKQHKDFYSKCEICEKEFGPKKNQEKADRALAIHMARMHNEK